jgi:hypothetical protein
MIERSIDDILNADELNTYVMSCYLTKDDLFKQLRRDLRVLCDYIRLRDMNA